MEKKVIVETLIKNGAKQLKNLVVKNVTVTPQENYVRVALSVDKPIRGFVSQEDGSYAEGETKVIFVSLFSIAALLRDDEEASFAVNHLLTNPEAAQVLLAGAKIAVLQEDVKEGTEYKNPWSEAKDATVTTMSHDTIINHVIDIELTKRAYTLLDRLAMSMLGV